MATMKWWALVLLAAALLFSDYLVVSDTLQTQRGISSVLHAYQLINRVLDYNHSTDDFEIELWNATTIDLPCELPCFVIDGHKRIRIRGGPTLSEVTAGIGWYLRHVAKVSIDLWPSTNWTVDTTNWPIPVQQRIMKRRIVPYSYFLNVCTHSYSLVWYTAQDWERFIDWMALSGINIMLALTGQEWIQYKVFRKFGLTDIDIRQWFNGPAYLTWSRGQNFHGNNIAGPLPISWMKSQWKLQREVILPRLRQLNIIGQLPGFQGNVPIQLATLLEDSNMTPQGDTGWMDSLDPWFGKIANVWMKTLIDDFGTDHWYQLDGYFNGGTAPWLQEHDDLWYRRGVAAYQGLHSTDPQAVWSFQGYSFVEWNMTPTTLSYLQGFSDSVTSPDRFMILDMSLSGNEWTQWNLKGASWIWTRLQNFGGTDGIKGNLRSVSMIPFEALDAGIRVVGVGATPEGINQNPLYYQFLFEQPFQERAQTNLTDDILRLAHHRYGLSYTQRINHPKIGKAWKLLLETLYQNDINAKDGTGIAHWAWQGIHNASSFFDHDRQLPTFTLCQVFGAWKALLEAGFESQGSNHDLHTTRTFQYDLVNLGREVLAQLSTPMALNFSDALTRPALDPTELNRTGYIYMRLLLDVDRLVATDDAFLLGRWLASARYQGRGMEDCDPPFLRPSQSSCAQFYEWNARCQITTWIPTSRNDSTIPNGPMDYASKHWNGLIRDYYAERVSKVLQGALEDAFLGQPLNTSKMDSIMAHHAFEWTVVDTTEYPTSSQGDFLLLSQELMEKYQHWFGSCSMSHGAKNTILNKGSIPSTRSSSSNSLDPVYRLVNRVLHYKNSKRDFDLTLLVDADSTPPCALPCFTIANTASGTITISGGPTLSEVTAGIGWYLRNVANVTSLDNWPPINVTNVNTSSHDWPRKLGSNHTIIKRRKVKYSYFMNVCTHSYSLVWYSAQDWERFIDWMALSGINMILALTGQEWIQYKVFRKLGLNDTDIRHWFNGPAFLTWSRGQNEYGSNIAGPLPISWMKLQWKLQRKVILPRLRELNIIGQLPAFQGNVPIQLKRVYQDSNITEDGATGWMDSLDPLFGKVAKVWMETLIQDFGTDHWYQLDGYFNGGTAPWTSQDRQSGSFSVSSTGHDNTWYQRGVAAYRGLNATDADAIWSFQGFAFVGWDNVQQASHLRGFVDSVPQKDRFVVIDMSYDPQQPEWKKWNNSAFFGASFIWTVLHNFGGTDGIKGDMRKINHIPFDALNVSRSANPIGLGATPEGITHNPAYYGFLYEQAFQDAPLSAVTQHIILKMHQRYGIDPRYDFHEEIAASWTFLLFSLYSTDRSVQDGTGVSHWGIRRISDGSSLFEKDRYTPTEMMCHVVSSWENLLNAGIKSQNHELRFHTSPAFQYDLVNLGREVLAQLSTPAALNFSDTISADRMDPIEVVRSGSFYQSLLLDLDVLVGTEKTFHLGRWLQSARRWGANSNDCEPPPAFRNDGSLLQTNKTRCEVFYEWNARCQVTTWNPTPANATSVPGGPIDYAAKHWHGLIQEYYVPRIHLVQEQALKDAIRQQRLNQTHVDWLMAKHAYQWTLVQSYERNYYDENLWHDNFIEVSRTMFRKYQSWFRGYCTNPQASMEMKTN